MSLSGDSDLLVQARGALLDALEALSEHRQAVVVVGAQAIHLRTGGVDVALAEATKDSDLALDMRLVTNDPLLEQAMKAANFYPNLQSGDPGAWLSASGVPVDLMVPEALAGPAAKDRRGGRINPHDKKATRRAVGLEAAVVDHSPMKIPPLQASDPRNYTANVAGPAGLLVAKLHKLGERKEKAPLRLRDKDAHDVYRLLVAVSTEVFVERFFVLAHDSLAGPVTTTAVHYLQELFAAGPEAPGCVMAGRAEQDVGDPATVAASVHALAEDLLLALQSATDKPLTQ